MVQSSAGFAGLQTVVITLFFASLATLTVCLRWYTRMFVVRRLGTEDYVIVASLVSLPQDSPKMCANIPSNATHQLASISFAALICVGKHIPLAASSVPQDSSMVTNRPQRPNMVREITSTHSPQNKFTRSWRYESLFRPYYYAKRHESGIVHQRSALPTLPHSDEAVNPFPVSTDLWKQDLDEDVQKHRGHVRYRDMLR